MKRTLALGFAAVILLLGAWLAPIAAHHLLPLSWTGESARLAGILGAIDGATIAEIGGGNGAMARAIAKTVGPGGRLYVTELSAERRGRLLAMARENRLTQLTVVEAAERATNLPTACCSALYMRNVLHHIDDWRGYAIDIARTVRPDGIVVVIDFAPGALPHLADDHGAAPDEVIAAFSAAGLRLERRDDRWGGGTYMLAFSRAP